MSKISLKGNSCSFHYFNFHADISFKIANIAGYVSCMKRMIQFPNGSNLVDAREQPSGSIKVAFNDGLTRSKKVTRT